MNPARKFIFFFRSPYPAKLPMRSTRIPRPLSQFLFLAAALCFAPGKALAHPVPDLPVRSHFSSDGAAEIRVEVDPRSFEADPKLYDYLTKEAADAKTPEEFAILVEKANGFVETRLRFHFDPLGEVRPVFEWGFCKLSDKGPLEKPDDAAVLVGSWKTSMPKGLSGYRIESLKMVKAEDVPMNVMFLNFIDKKQVERYAVLFPGETSFLLDLTGLSAPQPAAAPDAVGQTASQSDLLSIFWSEIKRGFLHVLPLGLDHVLFVLGMFLMSRHWKPLSFRSHYSLLPFIACIAHTLTLWMALGRVIVLSKVIEPIIAASIVAIAIENLIRSQYSHWRLLVVFVFGLIHGLGFAGVMATRLNSTSSLVVGLLGINIGVELGQIAILSIAFLATCWISNQEKYRKFVIIPGSILIALAGIWWVIERTVL